MARHIATLLRSGGPGAPADWDSQLHGSGHPADQGERCRALGWKAILHAGNCGRPACCASRRRRGHGEARPAAPARMLCRKARRCKRSRAGAPRLRRPRPALWAASNTRPPSVFVLPPKPQAPEYLAKAPPALDSAMAFLDENINQVRVRGCVGVLWVCVLPSSEVEVSLAMWPAHTHKQRMPSPATERRWGVPCWRGVVGGWHIAPSPACTCRAPHCSQTCPPLPPFRPSPTSRTILRSPPWRCRWAVVLAAA